MGGTPPGPGVAIFDTMRERENEVDAGDNSPEGRQPKIGIVSCGVMVIVMLQCRFGSFEVVHIDLTAGALETAKALLRGKM